MKRLSTCTCIGVTPVSTWQMPSISNLFGIMNLQEALQSRPAIALADLRGLLQEVQLYITKQIVESHARIKSPTDRSNLECN